jgi:hypothetical protein
MTIQKFDVFGVFNLFLPQFQLFWMWGEKKKEKCMVMCFLLRKS